MNLTDKSAQDAAITPAQARLAACSVLRSMHRIARTDPIGLTGLIMEVRFALGSEAIWHLCGLLELQRELPDPSLGWDETLERFSPDTRYYRVLLEKWRRGKGAGDPDGSE